MNDFWLQIRERLPEILRGGIAALVFIVLLSLLYGVMVRGLAHVRDADRLSVHGYTVLRRVGKWAIVVAAVLIVLGQFGMIDNAWTTLSALIALIAVGFVAVWSILSNTLCALILMIARPFDVGDTIEIPGDKLRGRVIDFNLIFTTLRDEEGHLVQIPNNTFFQKPIRREIGARTVALTEQADRDRPLNDAGPARSSSHSPKQ